ncbi:MAG: hypothetical protein H7A37_05715 [Chlamydiales bacterium]|nr:hypothetical protein [Chlamydiales bacterium]
MIRLVAFVLNVFLLSSTLFATNQDHVIRAAIDIGMGGPKLQVAEVDIKTNKIVKLLHSQRYFVNFYEGISKDNGNRLSDKVMRQGLEAFKSAVNVAHSFKADGIVAIATASFRSASNGLEFAKEIQDETAIKIHVIDQNLEGKLAFQAVLSKIDIQPENLIVWDIGGGSIQFVGMASDGSYLIDCGEEGVGAFNDYIIGNIQCQNIKECKTPNPMSDSDVLRAQTYAYSLSQKVSTSISDKLKDSSTKVVGAGSVFGHGIAATVGKNAFCFDDIAAVVQGLAGKTDADFDGGDFAFCEGSNTILAFGVMQGLGIEKMCIHNVNNADGALIYESFWK